MEEQLQIEQGIRLQQLIKALGLNQSSFARGLGMTQPNISRMINGENEISAEVLHRIMQAHNTVNLHWLLTGEGVPFIAPEAKQPADQVKEAPGAYTARGKGRLEELEERVARLEEAVRLLAEERKK